MVYHGHVVNGNVVVDHPEGLPDGAKVEIRVIGSAVGAKASTERPWLKYLGIIKDLPPDASKRVDEVLYGPPDE